MQIFMHYLRILALFTFIKDTFAAFFNCQIQESYPKRNQLSLWLENKLVGFIVALGGNLKRNQHSAYLVLGVFEAFKDKV
jgi:hypothetical protein